MTRYKKSLWHRRKINTWTWESKSLFRIILYDIVLWYGHLIYHPYLFESIPISKGKNRSISSANCYQYEVRRTNIQCTSIVLEVVWNYVAHILPTSYRIYFAPQRTKLSSLESIANNASFQICAWNYQIKLSELSNRFHHTGKNLIKTTFQPETCLTLPDNDVSIWQWKNKPCNSFWILVNCSSSWSAVWRIA